jgi:hypothetical protein
MQQESTGGFRAETRTGPAPYRPHTHGARAQLKSAAGFGIETRPAAPVYRPQRPIVTPPPIQPMARNSRPPEGSQDATGGRAMGPGIGQKPPRPVMGPAVQPRNRLSSAVQRYCIVSGSQILDKMPTKRAWFSYPYVVVNGAKFPAQKKGNLPEKHTFLEVQGGNVARVREHSGINLSLRVSDDCNMAIENTDLSQRQPKVFYATDQVIDASNTLLKTGKSLFRLTKGAQALTILPDWYQTKNLYEVTPRYRSGGLPPQNCNAMGARVLGMSAELLSMTIIPLAEKNARRVGGISQEEWNALFRNPKIPIEKLNRKTAKKYILHGSDSETKESGSNQYALPEVGDSYAIVTIGDSQPGDKPGTKIVRDIRSGEDRELGWEYHFGGVVARSGKDRITLENYARGDNRTDSGDPRWYFQMFGEQKNQSFHEFYSGKKDYSNPITIVHENPNRKS